MLDDVIIMLTEVIKAYSAHPAPLTHASRARKYPRRDCSKDWTGAGLPILGSDNVDYERRHACEPRRQPNK
jgi:hypothetical protein